MVNLSVIILTKNEQDTIKRCLTSIADWVSEMILIDNSDDRTKEIAYSIIPKDKLQIITSTESEDFSKLRNLGLEKASNEWVLFLDADEEVSSALTKEIEDVLGNEKIHGYYLKRHDYFLGKWLQHGETRDIRLLKLGKKQSGVWKRRVHEVWEIKGPTKELENPLFHYPHPTVAEFLERINRWTTLDAQEFYEKGIRASYFAIFAYPTGKFIRNYFLKQGFLDSMPGLIMALMMSFHSFLTRAKLYMLQTKETA